MKRFNEHFYSIKRAHAAKAEGTDKIQGKIEAIGSHFSMPNHDENDLQISELAFITLTP